MLLKGSVDLNSEAGIKREEETGRWHKLTVDRELKMVELKKRLKELEDRRS